jgi:hypothetical protein
MTKLDLFHQQRKPQNGRQATIAEYVRRQEALTGKKPTIAEVAKMFAIAEARVRVHFKALGLSR